MPPAIVPVVPEQKPSRNKTKDKEKDHKKQERLDDDFVGKSRKGKNQKNQAEIKKPQKQEKKKEEIRHPFLEEKIPWGLVPYTQALLLARYIRGDLNGYPAFLWK